MICRDLSLLILVSIVLVSAAIGFASRHYLGPDNVVEQAAEDVIQIETGVRVDLSPST